MADFQNRKTRPRALPGFSIISRLRIAGVHPGIRMNDRARKHQRQPSHARTPHFLVPSGFEDYRYAKSSKQKAGATCLVNQQKDQARHPEMHEAG